MSWKFWPFILRGAASAAHLRMTGSPFISCYAAALNKARPAPCFISRLKPACPASLSPWSPRSRAARRRSAPSSSRCRGLPARHPLAFARYRRLGQDRGARRIDLLVCAADAADVPRAAGAAAPRRRLLDRAARLLRADLRALPADGMGARQIRFHTLSRRRAGSGSASQFHHEHRRQWRARVLLYRAGRPFMLRTLSAALAVAVALSLSPAAQAAPADKPAAATQKPTVHKKKHVTRHWHGYGFPPRY